MINNERKIKCEIKYSINETKKSRDIEVKGDVKSILWGIIDMINVLSDETNINYRGLIMEYYKLGGNENE